MATAMGTKAKTPLEAAHDPNRKFMCLSCGVMKKREDFSISFDPFNKVGICPFCKDCIEKVARNWSPTGGFGDVTHKSLCEALERADLPFLDKVWTASIKELEDSFEKEGLRRSIWHLYLKNIKLPQYRGLRWRDSDITKLSQVNGIDEGGNMAEESKMEYKINRRDVIRMVGYDPFANYPIEKDLPVLYAQLINFIDDETKNDGMKMNAVIQIVQAFNQIQKLNDAINALSVDPGKINNNNGTIKQHAETISKLLSGANALAKDNGISLNYNNNKSKGQSTLSGKMKELDLIGFRNAKINMYDINYCKGMQQVAEISAKAQIDQLGMDENTMLEIANIRRELVDDLQKQRDKAVERARVLLVENRDLKEFLKEKGLIDDAGRVIDLEI